MKDHKAINLDERTKFLQNLRSGNPDAKIEADALKCKSCECSWFEQISVCQYHKLHNVILAQKIPQLDGAIFYLLKCSKCGEIHEPNVQIGPRDSLRSRYDSFLDHMESPIPETSIKKQKTTGRLKGEKV